MLLVKAVLFVMHIWVPLLSAIVHAALVILWSFSVYAQSASDMTDPKHPQRGAPWYITKSCSVVFNKNNIHYCRQAKAAFAVSIILLYVDHFDIFHHITLLMNSLIQPSIHYKHHMGSVLHVSKQRRTTS